MQFLEPFVKRRRTMTNIKSALPSGRYFNLQKNFGSHEGKEMTSSIKTATSKQIPMNTIIKSASTAQNLRNFGSHNEKEMTSTKVAILKQFSTDNITKSACTIQNLRNFGSHDEKETTSSTKTATSKQFPTDNITKSACTIQNLRNFGSHDEKETTSSTKTATSKQFPTDNITKLACTIQNLRNFDSHDEKETTSSTKTATSKQFPTDSITKSVCAAQDLRNFDSCGEEIINIDADNIDSSSTAQHLKDSNSGIHSNISDISSISELSASDYARNKGFIGSRVKSKGKQPDILHNAISKVTSLLESKYSTSSSSISSSSLKSEVTEDMALCQLILSSLTNMPPTKKADKKKELLRIIYDI